MPQRVLFAKAFGCTRFVYNTLLEEKKKHYEKPPLQMRSIKWWEYVTPEVIAIGGRVSGAGDFLFEPLRKNAKSKFFYRADCKIVPAASGNDAGIIGAARLL